MQGGQVRAINDLHSVLLWLTEDYRDALREHRLALEHEVELERASAEGAKGASEIVSQQMGVGGAESGSPSGSTISGAADAKLRRADVLVGLVAEVWPEIHEEAERVGAHLAAMATRVRLVVDANDDS